MKESASQGQRYFLRGFNVLVGSLFLSTLGFAGVAPGRGIDAVGFTRRRPASASLSGIGMRMLLPGFGIFPFNGAAGRNRTGMGAMPASGQHWYVCLFRHSRSLTLCRVSERRLFPFRQAISTRGDLFNPPSLHLRYMPVQSRFDFRAFDLPPLTLGQLFSDYRDMDRPASGSDHVRDVIQLISLEVGHRYASSKSYYRRRGLRASRKLGDHGAKLRLNLI